MIHHRREGGSTVGVILLLGLGDPLGVELHAGIASRLWRADKVCNPRTTVSRVSVHGKLLRVRGAP